MALEEYIAQEIALDCKDGLLSRREAIRRLGLMGNRGDDSCRPFPLVGSFVSGGGNGNQSAGEELARRNTDVG